MRLPSVLNTFCALLLLISLSCTKNQEKKQTLVLGHAGTSISPERYVYPPNTEEAILYALDVLGADGVEIDFQLSRDTNLYGYHDSFLEEFTDGKGCVGQKNSNELNELRYYNKYRLIDLKRAVEICKQRKKIILLDFKRYNYCEQGYIDYKACGIAVKNVLNSLEIHEKKRIIASSNDLNLLASITDTTILKCFETRNINEGIKQFKPFNLDLLVLHLEDFSDAHKKTLDANGIRYVLQGVKTTNDIKQAERFAPYAVISDNIALTKKKIN